MQSLKLFSRVDCHLCDQAQALVITVLNESNLDQHYDLIKVDIDSDNALKDKYALKIPVLLREGYDNLDWPFPASRLRKYLQVD